jgi:hypothetical protein
MAFKENAFQHQKKKHLDDSSPSNKQINLHFDSNS